MTQILNSDAIKTDMQCYCTYIGNTAGLARAEFGSKALSEALHSLTQAVSGAGGGGYHLGLPTKHLSFLKKKYSTCSSCIFYFQVCCTFLGAILDIDRPVHGSSKNETCKYLFIICLTDTYNNTCSPVTL